MIKEQTVFTSPVSMADAQMKAKLAGYQIVGQSTKSGQFVVFARPTNARRQAWG